MDEQYKREVAYRIFSDALKTAELVDREEGEYATQYIKLSTGQLINRVFVCGALIEKEDVGNDSEYWKLVVSDCKGTFRAYIGMYQESALSIIEDIDVPSFVAMVCKVKSNEYNDKTYFSLAPESITVIDESTYDRWTTETEEHTEARNVGQDV